MAFRPTPSSNDRHAYVPPQMKQALADHMQKSVPAHLKNYQQDGRAYIPTHVEKAIVDHMNKSVPAHMKEYVGAYVQQNVVFPAAGGPQPKAPMSAPHMPRSTAGARQPIPQIPRQPGYSRPLNSPSTVELIKSAQQTTNPPPLVPLPPADQTPPSPPQPTPIYPEAPTPASSDPVYPYDFIMNPDQPATPKKSLLPGSGDSGTKGIVLRVGLVAGGLVVLLIIFSVVRGLLTGGGSQPHLITVVQDQQELVQLTTKATQQQGISTTNSNFAATASLSLSSAQSDMIQYLSVTGVKKIEPKALNLKVSAKTDKQLTDAAVASTYNETFHGLMKTKLETYQRDLQQAYNKTSGPNGRKLLSAQFDQAELLLVQLESEHPAS